MDLNSNTVAKCGFNCYDIANGNDMRLRNSVFLHDTSPRLFMYGTTDVIIGTVTGNNAIEVCGRVDLLACLAALPLPALAYAMPCPAVACLCLQPCKL